MPRPVRSFAAWRCLFGCAATVLLLPSAVGAQLMPLEGDTHQTDRLRVTPFAGWVAAITREESWHYRDAAGTAVSDRADMMLAGGPVAGLVVEVAWRGPFRLLAGAAYVDRDDTEFSVNGGEPVVFTGSSNVLIKAGVGMELREEANQMTVRRLGAGAFLAPFYLLEMPKQIASIPDEQLFEAAHHFGVNLGVTGELPFAADRFAIQLGFEDYLTLWNGGALQRLPDWVREASGDNATEVDADLSHQWLVRAGVSFRFR